MIITEDSVGGMVEVDHQGVYFLLPAACSDKVEEVIADKPCPRVIGEALSVSEKLPLVPTDDPVQGLDNEQVVDARVPQGFPGGVPQTKSGDQHTKSLPLDGSQP